MNKEKIREERIFEIVHCPFEGRAKLHHLCQPNGPVSWCQLGGNSKGQCTISKILFPLLLYKFTEQNIFFPETCFVYPISEVCCQRMQQFFQDWCCPVNRGGCIKNATALNILGKTDIQLSFCVVIGYIYNISLVYHTRRPSNAFWGAKCACIFKLS